MTGTLNGPDLNLSRSFNDTKLQRNFLGSHFSHTAATELREVAVFITDIFIYEIDEQFRPRLDVPQLMLPKGSTGEKM